MTLDITDMDYSSIAWSYIRYPPFSLRPPPTEDCTGLTRQRVNEKYQSVERGAKSRREVNAYMQEE